MSIYWAFLYILGVQALPLGSDFPVESPNPFLGMLSSYITITTFSNIARASVIMLFDTFENLNLIFFFRIVCCCFSQRLKWYATTWWLVSWRKANSEWSFGWVYSGCRLCIIQWKWNGINWAWKVCSVIYCNFYNNANWCPLNMEINLLKIQCSWLFRVLALYKCLTDCVAFIHVSNRYADWIHISDNYFEVNEIDIASLKVLKTYVGGKVVFPLSDSQP